MATKKKPQAEETQKENINAKLNEKELSFFSSFVSAENLMDISLSRSVEEDMAPIEVIDTGSYLLNDALGCDGLPCGRLIQYYGEKGCHRKGQGILMYDGTIKSVENIQVGDQLMGMDSTPRTVLQLCRGVDEMVEIIPTKGNPFVVNRNHILTLVRTGKVNSGTNYIKLNEIVDIPVSVYLELSKTKKHYLELLRSPVSFTKKELPLDPYFLGILLGDAHFGRTISFTTQDDVLLNALTEKAKSIGVNVVKKSDPLNSRCPSYFLSTKTLKNYLLDSIKNLKLNGSLSGNKFIPHEYKSSSEDDRLEILAGILDTDGSLQSGCFDYITKSKKLADDVAFIARSLGFSAYPKKCTKGIKSTGFVGEYYKMCISGNIDRIPTKLIRKQASPRLQIKNVLRVGFKTNILPKEEYFGFRVDGDNRYLLDDFTITHNSGKTLNAMIAIKNAQIKDPSAKQLFIDAEQTFDKKWCKKLGIDPTKIIVVDGETAIYGRKCFELLLGVPKEDVKTRAFVGKQKLGLLDRIASKEFNVNMIVLDSLGTLIPPGEDTAIVGKMNMALMARFLSTTMKKLTIEVSKANIPMIVINHIKATMDMYGPDHTSSGGNSYFHTLSANVYFEPVNRKDAQILDEDENKIGGTIRFTIEKSKFGPYPKRGEFRMHFTKGIIDKHLELIKLGIKYSVIKRPSTMSYEFEGEKITGMPKLEVYFKDNNDMCELLLSKIKEAKASGIEEVSISSVSEDQSDDDIGSMINQSDGAEE
jgi:RecA/RadA recombinase